MHRYFNNPTKGRLDFNQTVDEMVAYINGDPKSAYSLVIGTDSHKNGKPDAADFVTAIVVHRQGSGARYFWNRSAKKKIYTLHDKIYQETLMSLDLAEILVPVLSDRMDPDTTRYRLEIHIDVGQNGPTRDMIREVVGMVVGNGYTAKTKPDAYGAFVVADRYTT